VESTSITAIERDSSKFISIIILS